MFRPHLLRLTGIAAMLGGTLWTAAVVIHGSKPRGCVGEECAYRPMRAGAPLDATLMLLSLALIAVGVFGVVALAKGTSGFGRTGWSGVALTAAGTLVLVVSTSVQAAFFEGDFPLMPYVVVPAVLALIAGILLLGVGIFRSQVLPRWTSAMLIVGAVAMIGFNEQTSAVLLAIPLGLAWVAMGFVLCSGKVDGRRS